DERRLARDPGARRLSRHDSEEEQKPVMVDEVRHGPSLGGTKRASGTCVSGAVMTSKVQSRLPSGRRGAAATEPDHVPLGGSWNVRSFASFRSSSTFEPAAPTTVSRSAPPRHA